MNECLMLIYTFISICARGKISNYAERQDELDNIRQERSHSPVSSHPFFELPEMRLFNDSIPTVFCRS